MSAAAKMQPRPEGARRASALEGIEHQLARIADALEALTDAAAGGARVAHQKEAAAERAAAQAATSAEVARWAERPVRFGTQHVKG